MKLLYDASILANGCHPGGNRSGVYFTALNILKELIKREDVELTLYCRDEYYIDLLKSLKIEFPNEKFKIIEPCLLSPKYELYKKLSDLRTESRNKKEKFIKFIIQIALLFISIDVKFSKLFKKEVHRNFGKYDVYFSPWAAPQKEIIHAKKIKRFVILYDLIPVVLEKYKSGAASGTWFREVLDSLNSDDYYFSISEFTRDDFLKYYPVITPEKFVTALLACNENFSPQIEEKIVKSKEKYGIPLDKKYVFSLCTLEPRKNLIREVKTFVQFINKNNIEDIIFVLGGGHHDAFLAELKKEIGSLKGYEDKIIHIGYVDDEDLAPLYSGAEWFVYTSQYEGFGLPPLEAMSCGCPVITSNNSSLPEVVADAGIMIDWDSDEQHIEAYEKYYFNPELRKQNSQKGLERAKMFSWEKCVNDMVNFMKLSLKGK